MPSASEAPAAATTDHDAALAACARGDRLGLRAIYDREARWLLGVALRIVRDRAAAEDVLHDAFLRIWQRAASFDPRLGSGRGWIYTVVRHAALDHVRRAGRETAVEEAALEPLLEAAHGSTDGGAAADEVGALAHCLDRLETQRREAIVHAFVDGYTHEQIARRLNAPLGTVKSWIRRGLASLRQCLTS